MTEQDQVYYTAVLTEAFDKVKSVYRNVGDTATRNRLLKALNQIARANLEIAQAWPTDEPPTTS